MRPHLRLASPASPPIRSHFTFNKEQMQQVGGSCRQGWQQEAHGWQRLWLACSGTPCAFAVHLRTSCSAHQPPAAAPLLPLQLAHAAYGSRRLSRFDTSIYSSARDATKKEVRGPC